MQAITPPPERAPVAGLLVMAAGPAAAAIRLRLDRLPPQPPAAGASGPHRGALHHPTHGHAHPAAHRPPPRPPQPLSHRHAHPHGHGYRHGHTLPHGHGHPSPSPTTTPSPTVTPSPAPTPDHRPHARQRLYPRTNPTPPPPSAALPCAAGMSSASSSAAIPGRMSSSLPRPGRQRWLDSRSAGFPPALSITPTLEKRIVADSSNAKSACSAISPWARPAWCAASSITNSRPTISPPSASMSAAKK